MLSQELGRPLATAHDLRRTHCRQNCKMARDPNSSRVVAARVTPFQTFLFAFHGRALPLRAGYKLDKSTFFSSLRAPRLLNRTTSMSNLRCRTAQSPNTALIPAG